MTEQLYFDDPLTLEFTAQVSECCPLENGRFGLVLPRWSANSNNSTPLNWTRKRFAPEFYLLRPTNWWPMHG